MSIKWLFGLTLLLFDILHIVPSQFPEPTRAIDLWNPFGTTTTRRPGLVKKFYYFVNAKVFIYYNLLKHFY